MKPDAALQIHIGHVECASLLALSLRQLAGGEGIPTVSHRRPRPPARASSRGEGGSKLPHSIRRDEWGEIMLNPTDFEIGRKQDSLSPWERAGERENMETAP